MNKMHNPPHPGKVLREYLPAALTLVDVAWRNAPGPVRRSQWPCRRERGNGGPPVECAGYERRTLAGHADAIRAVAGNEKTDVARAAAERISDSAAAKKTVDRHLARCSEQKCAIMLRDNCNLI